MHQKEVMDVILGSGLSFYFAFATMEILVVLVSDVAATTTAAVLSFFSYCSATVDAEILASKSIQIEGARIIGPFLIICIFFSSFLYVVP